jgi:hypothetical protein
MNSKNRLVTIFLFLVLAADWQVSTSFAEQQGVKSPGTRAATAANLSWSQFEDPSERAFTLDVPQGWTAKGGLFRLGYSDYRPMVNLQSPDGRTEIRFGDVAIPSYSLPSQFHEREGELYDLGAQAQMTVARYRTGPDFAVLYAKARFSSLCQSLTPHQNDLPPPWVETSSQAGGQSSQGQVTYQCNSGPGSRIAYAYAKTDRSPTLWQVTSLVSFIAPPEQVAIVRSIILHGSQSLRFNSEWIQYQKNMDEQALVYQRQRQQARLRALSQQVAQFESKMQSMQNQVSAFERGQASQAKQIEGFTNALVGITPTTDPLGNPRNVWTGSKSGYWTNGLGQTVNSDISPGPGWQPLKPNQ